VLSTLLWPLSILTRLEVARRVRQFRRHPERIMHSRLPVIVVGNLFVGGTGKTPVVIALARALQARGWQPGVISRGYGVKPDARPLTGHGALDASRFGDEPALIAAATGVPVSVHPHRAQALERLEKTYPQVDVIISDDGLQHLALGRDLEIVVQDSRGIGNGRLLPAGPLREPASRLETVDFIITNLERDAPAPRLPVVLPGRTTTMTLQPVRLENLSTGQVLSWATWHRQHTDAPCSAVAGIGNPQRFFSMLQDHGVMLSRTIHLPDHYDFRQSPFEQLDEPQVLITAKDAVKCQAWANPRIWVVHVEPVFGNPEWLDICHDMLRVIAQFKAEKLRTNTQPPGQRRPPSSRSGKLTG
jgi:tetraacyldisaccharide 4'-kinase